MSDEVEGVEARDTLIDTEARQTTNLQGRLGTPSLLSLPDELLSTCFELAVEEYERDGAFPALRLSHVSSRCRAVALRNARIWTTLQHDLRLRSLKFIKACIARSKKHPFTIAVTFSNANYVDRVTATEFLSFLKKRISPDRWKRVVVIYLADKSFLKSGKMSAESISHHLGPNSFLRNLKPDRIVTRVDRNQENVTTEAGDKLGLLWSETFLESKVMHASLKQLTISTLPIIPYHGGLKFESLSYLHLVLEYELKTSFARLLGCCPSLQDLRVTMTSLWPLGFDSEQAQVAFPSIRNLRFRIFIHHDTYNYGVQLALKNCLFPNAVTMDIHLEFVVPNSAFLKRTANNFRPFVEDIIPNEQRYPALEKLSMLFEMKDFERKSAACPESMNRGAVTSFPLKHLPSLKHLEIQTDLQLMVHAPIPDFFLQSKSKFPALRSLKFGGPQLKIHKWVGLVVQSLKQRGEWATFEELVVPPEMALPEASDGVMRGEAISDWIRANIR